MRRCAWWQSGPRSGEGKLATSTEIQAVWRILSANYVTHAKSLTAGQLAEQLEVWFALLSDLDAELLRAAALQHMAASKWFPTVAELREIVAALLSERPATAMEEWGLVVETFSDLRFYRYADGYHKFPAFENAITARVVQAMGWTRLKESEDSTADRARFLQAYDTLAQRAREDGLLLPQVRELGEQQRLRHSATAALVGQVAARLRLGGAA